MNILVLNWRDIRHPLAGGAEISTHEHARGWVKAGHRVTIFSSSFEGAKDFETIDGVFIVRRGSHYTVHLYAYFYYIWEAKQNVDFVVDEFHFIPFFTPLYVREKKLAFIHETAEEIWFKNQSFPFSILGYILEPWFFRLYRQVPFMTVSQSTKRDLRKFGIPPENIHIIHNGVNRILVHESKSALPTVIFLGRIAKDKGIDDAVRAFALIAGKIKSCRLWIVGKEETKGEMRKLIELIGNLGLTKNTKIFGFVFEKDKFKLLREAHILIHPSVKEGWGLTVIEAASVGTPTVAYDTAGLSDSIVHDRTGIIVKNHTPEELAKAAVMLFTNKRFYEKISAQAVVRSRQFSWSKSVQNSLALIQKIV